MAEGFARTIGWNAFSAGVHPSSAVNPNAIRVMKELYIDISHQKTHFIDEYIRDDFDVVVTVSDYAKEQCPLFTGRCKMIIHHSFPDPWEVTGSDSEILSAYRDVRDQIKIWLQSFTQEEFSQ